MKKIILALSFLFFVLAANAQKNKYLVDEYGNPMHYSIANRFSNCNIFLVVDGSTEQVTPFEYLNNLALGNVVLLKGATSIELESRIQKDSLIFYRYSIIENDSIQLKRDAIPVKIKYKWGKGSVLPNYVAVDLGTFNVIGKKIEVQIFRIDNKKRVSRVFIYNKPILPPQCLSFKVLEKKGAKNIKNRTNLIVNEKVKGIRVMMKNTDFNILYSVTVDHVDARSSATLEPKWKLIKGTNLVIGDINVEDFISSGKYEIIVYPKTRTYSYWKDNTLARTFHFTVTRNKAKLFSEKQLIIYGLIFCAAAGAIFGAAVTYIKKKEAKKLALQFRDKEIAKLRLESVRSQLNPHFLFNALAGIQTLMNKNEIDNANRYLVKFARLTRNVLDHKELISLTSEKTLLDDYLQMEQLRFGFHYQISASPDLDVENIEIPAMLLQPFVENAVKHGIAEKGNDGKIEIDFIKRSTDLILSIKDNGDGFDVTKNYEGLGLALTKNRISLLNSIYKENQFLLEMKADVEGTIIEITLSQWL
jgi:two-component system LytT family sensor kinase